jgi:23S rRNA (uracil1939-C5)-methyltransferase
MQLIELEVTAMAHGGRALGKHSDGRIVFVSGAIPGERVEARVTAEKGRVLFAEAVRLLEDSADRVGARCPHFARGCCASWQHIAYEAQVLLKQDVLCDQLDRVGGLSDALVAAALRPAVSAAQVWHYKHAMTFTLQPVADSAPAATVSADDAEDGVSVPTGQLGLRTEQGQWLPLDDCPLLHPDLWTIYDELNLQIDTLRTVRLQIDSFGSKMLVLTLKGTELPNLTLDLPLSVNVLLDEDEPMNLIGDTHGRYTVGGRTLRATAGVAMRAHVPMLTPLVDATLALLQPQAGEHVLDLYGGIGMFSVALAPRVGKLTLIEAYPPAVTDADANLAEWDHVDLIEGRAEDVLADATALRGRVSAVLLDPPSEGLSVAVVDAVAALGAARVLYVSSDAATLSRDLKRLRTHGYEVVALQMVDTAPQTHEFTSLALLTRA